MKFIEFYQSYGEVRFKKKCRFPIYQPDYGEGEGGGGEGEVRRPRTRYRHVPGITMEKII